MKTMTCQQLGGPCGSLNSAATPRMRCDQGSQDQHLKDMVAGGDEAHESALKEMKGRCGKRPLSGMGWYRKTKRDFAALQND